MNVVVVAKTRMGQNICVGAVHAETGDLLRLIPRADAAYHSWRKFEAEIGDLIRLAGARATAIDPPHVEDFLVDTWASTGNKERNLPAWIRGKCLVWKGDRSSLFDGKLRFNSRGTGRIERGDPLPTQSVGFWELPAPMRLEPDNNKRYALAGPVSLSAPYVGLVPPPKRIAKRALVRVSLSRWWAPDASRPEACWLQISGRY